MTTLTGDEDRLVQAFANLVDNALKFTPANGEVVIRAGQAAGQVEVSVSDTGPGIPAEDIPASSIVSTRQINPAAESGAAPGWG